MLVGSGGFELRLLEAECVSSCSVWGACLKHFSLRFIQRPTYCKTPVPNPLLSLKLFRVKEGYHNEVLVI